MSFLQEGRHHEAQRIFVFILNNGFSVKAQGFAHYGLAMISFTESARDGCKDRKPIQIAISHAEQAALRLTWTDGLMLLGLCYQNAIVNIQQRHSGSLDEKRRELILLTERAIRSFDAGEKLCGGYGDSIVQMVRSLRALELQLKHGGQNPADN
jgi:hypothetical protein